MCGAETWTLRKVGQMYRQSFEMWCWRKISWTDHGWNEEVLQETNILQTVQWRKVDWTGHILCRNCGPEHVVGGRIEGKIEVRIRRGRRCKQLLDDLKDARRYWKLQEAALDRTVWRTGLGRRYVPVVTHYMMMIMMMTGGGVTAPYVMSTAVRNEDGGYAAMLVTLCLLCFTEAPCFCCNSVDRLVRRVVYTCRRPLLVRSVLTAQASRGN